MSHSYYSIFNKYIHLVLGHWKFATDNPSPFGLRVWVYQWQTSSDLGLRPDICQIQLVAVVYVIYKPQQLGVYNKHMTRVRGQRKFAIDKP